MPYLTVKRAIELLELDIAENWRWYVGTRNFVYRAIMDEYRRRTPHA